MKGATHDGNLVKKLGIFWSSGIKGSFTYDVHDLGGKGGPEIL